MIYSQASSNVHADRLDHRLIDNAKHRDYILVLRLRDEFGQNTHIVQRSLRVGNPHRAVQPAKPVKYLDKGLILAKCIRTS